MSEVTVTSTSTDTANSANGGSAVSGSAVSGSTTANEATITLQGIRVWDTGEIIDVVIPKLREGFVAEAGSSQLVQRLDAGESIVIDATGLTLAPGFEDPHVHFRDPGQQHKETMQTGSHAAAFGGYTHVLIMPNTEPALDGRTIMLDGQEVNSLEQVRGWEQDHEMLPVRYSVCVSASLGRAGKEATPKELWSSAMPSTRLERQLALSHPVIAISDDGNAITDPVLPQTMKDAKATGITVIDHCEHHDSGVMNAGQTATQLGVPGIKADTELAIVQRDIEAAARTGVPVHLQHISTALAINAIREAKTQGIPVTCETAPHYIALCDEDVARLGTLAKMNPPLRTAQDRAAVRAAIADGTIDMIATDHAPHTAQEKEQGLLEAPNGIIGLETAFAVCYQELVDAGWIEESKLIELMSVAPAQLMGHQSTDIAALLNTSAPCAVRRTLDLRTVEHPQTVDLVVLDTSTHWTVDVDAFHSKARNCPFNGWDVHARSMATIIGSELASSRLA